MVARCVRQTGVVFFLLASIATAQISDRISSVRVGTATAGQPLIIQADLVQPASLDRIEIAYRQFGESSFRRMEMAISGNTAAVTLPGTSVVPPFVEYYFILTIRNSAVPPETYPIENAEQQPLKVSVGEEQGVLGRLIILSPDANEELRASDVLISFSLINFDSTLDRSTIKVSIDNRDISPGAVISGDLVVLRPENLSTALEAGSHKLVIELRDLRGELLERDAAEFSVRSPESVSPPRQGTSQWTYGGSAVLESRNENIQDVSTPYNRATLNARAQYNEFRILGNLHVTDEEKADRQPQDRFFIGGESPWLKLGYGDSYPVFPDLFMNGKRVRGLSGNLTLGAFNLDVAEGDIVRKVEGDTLKTFSADSLTAEQQRDPSGLYVLYDPATQRWAKLQSYGTFDRNLIVVRPSFGKRDESHLGFTYLKSKDDINSTQFGNKPEENLVLGSDMVVVLDQRRFELNGQVAVSATNRDITDGSFSDSRIDSIFSDYSSSSRNTIKRIRDIVSPFITVNENLVPLNAKHMPTLSYEGNLLLDYFDNNFKMSYLRHGESYESFGQSFLQTDVAGYNISDRIRLIQNQVFLTGGVERLEDNTAETKSTTTANTTINVGVSYFPLADAPSVTVAYLHASNLNDRPLTDSVYAVDDETNRVLFQLGKEFTWCGEQNASISVSTSTRDDHTYHHLDTRNTAVTLSNSSQFTIPLQTVLSISVNSSKFVTSDTSSPTGQSPTTLSYTTITASAQYRTLEDRLRLNTLLSPTFGDIERVLVDASAQYYFTKNLSIQPQLTLYFNSKLFSVVSVTNDVVWSIILRADI